MPGTGGFSVRLNILLPFARKNAMIGGANYSMHLSGRAVDVRVANGDQRWRIVRAAMSLGLSVGIMENAVHIDDRDGIPVLFHYYASKRRT